MVCLGAQLLLGPAAILLEVGRIGVLLPLLSVGLFYGFMHYRSHHLTHPTPLISAHWQLALARFSLLFIGYGITSLLLLLSWWLSTVIDPQSPQRFLSIALARIGVMPALLMVFVLLVMENMALDMALRGQLPNRDSNPSHP